MSPGAPHLVGREAELEILDRTLSHALARTPQAVGIVGEAGIGKSRLLDELGRRAAERGALVVSGRAAELERDVPFSPWIDALDDIVADAGEGALAALDPDRLADLAVALPAVQRAAGVAPARTGERHRVARAMRSLLEHLSAQRPVAVLLDDVHWADRASAEVVALLLNRLPHGGVLLALASRPNRVPELEAALHAAAGRGDGQVLGIAGLSRAAVDALLGRSLDPAARIELFRESRGNPFYLQALATARPRASEASEGAATSGVPRAVVAALAGEIAALDDRGRDLVQGAAVAGDPFDLATAAAAADLDEPEALAALDAVLAADLVRPTEEPWRFAFRHPLVRRAVYESAGGGWKLAAHARAAATLAARGATLGERAHHIARAARAGDLDAAGLLTAAGDETSLMAPATAAGWYGAALRLVPEGPEHAERRLQLLGARATALASAGRAVEARNTLRRILALLPPDAAAVRVGTVAALAELQVLWTQQPDEARGLLEAERAALGAVTPGLHATLTLVLARERAVHADHAGAEALAEEARAAACAAGDAALEAEAAAVAADAAHCRLRDDDDAARREVDAKIAAAAELVGGLPDDRVAQRMQMVLWLAVAHYFTGDLATARMVAERGIRVARATGQGLYAPTFVCVRGWIDTERGRLDAAEADLDEALEAAHLLGNVQLGYWSHVALSQIAVHRGRADDALAHAQAAWDALGVIEYSQAAYAVPDARLAAGDVKGALSALETFGWVNPGLWTLDRLKAIDVSVRVLLAVGRVDEAEAWARRAPAEAGGRRTGVSGAAIALSQARVRLARGAPEDAARIAQQGAASAVAGDAPIWAARCRTLAGQALIAAAQAEAARVELRRAAADLDALGAVGRRDEALRLLRRLGERPRPGVRAGDGARPLAELTPREREVAVLVAEGCTNAQIAARLHLSESTVEKHVSRVLAKLGVGTRAGVVRRLAAASA